VLALAGCAGRNGGGGGGALVKITERDFSISAPARAASGSLDLSVDNRGPDAHELIIVRTSGRQLPLRADGITVDEEGLEQANVATLEPGQPDHVRHLKLRLRPGRYELFCNMSGHYMGGMHRVLVVA
jgi:uncharacterized cupredoxin-like copper-binding protein